MKHKCPICKTPTDSTAERGLPVLQRTMPRSRPRQLGSEKYVVSEPIFNEDENESPEVPPNPTRKTIILDLDEQNRE